MFFGIEKKKKIHIPRTATLLRLQNPLSVLTMFWGGRAVLVRVGAPVVVPWRPWVVMASGGCDAVLPEFVVIRVLPPGRCRRLALSARFVSTLILPILLVAVLAAGKAVNVSVAPRAVQCCVIILIHTLCKKNAQTIGAVVCWAASVS